MTKPMGVLITERTISLILNGKPFNITDSHVNFELIRQNLLDKNYDNLQNLIDVVRTISSKIESIPNTSLTIQNEEVLYKGYPIHNVLSKKLLEELRNGYDISGFAKFVDNLMQNPSSTAINELYLFIEKANLPLTDDGHFLAYKKVRDDYKDVHSGTFDNSIGSICEMPRNLVDDNRDRTCSNGFHFCSYSYLFHFGGERVMILKINPKDVVSIPSDYNDTKGRTCRYEVIGEVENWKDDDIFKNAHGSKWDNSYNDEDYEEEYSYNDEDYQEMFSSGYSDEDINGINPLIQEDEVSLDGGSSGDWKKVYSNKAQGRYYVEGIGSLTINPGGSHIFRNATNQFISKKKAYEIGLIEALKIIGVHV